MPIFTVKTPQHAYQNVVERGVVRRIAEFIPARAGRLFVVTTEDVWRLHGEKLKGQFGGKSPEVLFFPGGEANKRLSSVEGLAGACGFSLLEVRMSSMLSLDFDGFDWTS